MKPLRHAFTLVELSIVLVILGLLVGGVLAGQALIESAQLRSVTSEFNAYQTAMNTFKDKYFSLPGDMSNATSYWGIAAGTTGNDLTCRAATGTGTATCNGTGNGVVLNSPIYASDSASVNAERFEQFRFWQHLANAGLIEGSYTGVGGSSTSNQQGCTIGTNCPRSRTPSATWQPVYLGGTIPGITWWENVIFNGSYGHILVLATPTSATANPTAAALSAQNAYNVDMKIDDGKAGTGIVSANRRGVGSYSAVFTTVTNCSTQTAAANGGTAEYDLTQVGLACALHFKTGF